MIDHYLKEKIILATNALYQTKDEEISALISLQKTKKEFEGDYTLNVFPLIKFTKISPEETAQAIGHWLTQATSTVVAFNVVKGFLNLVIDTSYWMDFFTKEHTNLTFGHKTMNPEEVIVIEYSSPNTNKPLHLGHIRNNLLGYAVAEIAKANGKNVKKVNLVNDRGIHICKSMLAWQKWGNNETPTSSGLKGDHLVGKYYVLFDKKNKEQVEELLANGMEEELAKKSTPLLKEAQDMLLLWEQGDEPTTDLWRMMNQWTYDGFAITYERLGVNFDQIDYESNTYLLGKQLVEEGLKNNLLFKKEDNSVWADLTPQGLDQKLLLRSDGTSVYMTQDLGTAVIRQKTFQAQQMVYVVGNEQNYHFDVLKRILLLLGESWATQIYHLSYGMVELPEGKMKSREGKVVDADDLIDEMIDTAKKTTEELGKIDGFTPEEATDLYRKIGLGALKYFILKVDPKKTMLFNPKESIDFNGNTGPFIQYTYARINSVLKKYPHEIELTKTIPLAPKEKELLKLIYEYPSVVSLAGEHQSPALIANYMYELAKSYNQFYQEHSILKEPNKAIADFRIKLSGFTAQVIKLGMGLLGIEMADRM